MVHTGGLFFYTWFCAAWKELGGIIPRAPFLIWALCGAGAYLFSDKPCPSHLPFKPLLKHVNLNQFTAHSPAFFCSCFFQNIFIRLIFKALNFYFGVISALANAYTSLFCQPHLVDSLLYRSDERFYDFLKTFRFLGRTLRQKSCNVVRIGSVFLAKKDIIRRKL